MSDLDDRLIQVLRDDNLIPDQKLEKIRELFAANEKLEKIPCATKEFLINPNFRVNDVIASLQYNLTAAGIAAKYENHEKIVEYLLARKFDPHPPLIVACLLSKAELARELILNYSIDLSYALSQLYTIQSVFKHNLPALHLSYTSLQAAISLLKSTKPKFFAESKEQKVSSHDHAWDMQMQIEQSLLIAWENDRFFVIEYLAARLHDIHNKKLNEADLLYMVPLTQKIHSWVNKKLAHDLAGKNLFQNNLLSAWAAYTSKPDGFFKTIAKRDAFLEEMGGGELIGKQFAEQKVQSDFQSAIDTVKKPARPLNYFEKYYRLNKSEQRKLINDFRHESKGEGFYSDDIILSVAKMANDFGLSNFTFAICGSGNGADEYDLADQLTMPLRAEVRFILAVFQSLGSTHAVGICIDKITGAIEVVDPAGRRYGGQQEFIQRMNGALPALTEFLPKAKLIVPPKEAIFPQRADDNDCGIYTAVSLFGLLLCKTADAKAKSSDIPEVDNVLKSLHLDVAKGKLPQTRFLDSYLGALLLARSDARLDDKLQKQWQEVFTNAGAVREIISPSLLRRRA